MPGNVNVNRMAQSKLELREFNIQDFPPFPAEAIEGEVKRRKDLIAKWNADVIAWRQRTNELLQQWLLALKE